MSVTLLDSSRAEGRYIGRGTVTPEQVSRAKARSKELQKYFRKDLRVEEL